MGYTAFMNYLHVQRNITMPRSIAIKQIMARGIFADDSIERILVKSEVGNDRYFSYLINLYC